MGTRPCGCPLDVGRTFRPQLGIGGVRCDCCGSFEICVKLPVGAGHLHNCVHCLNPRPTSVPTRKRARKDHHTLVSSKLVRLPDSLRKMIDGDLDQIRNDAPSAQKQKAASRCDEEDDG